MLTDLFKSPCFCLQIIVTFGNHVLQAPVTGDPYMQKYKGVWLSITVLTRALAGNYCNFGVFDLYGDPALKVRCRQLHWVPPLWCTGACHQ